VGFLLVSSPKADSLTGPNH